MNLPEQIVRRYDQLDSEKGTLKGHWQEIADYMMPSRSSIISEGALGAKRMSKIFDGTAIRALGICRNGLYSHLNPPGSPWFEFTVKDKRLKEIFQVKQWLRETTEATRDALNASNFGLAIHEAYTDLTGFGTACLYEDEGVKSILNFQALSLANTCIVEGPRGVVDTVYRLEKFRARNLVALWPGTASDAVRNALKRNPDEKFDVIHAVFPRHERGKFYDPGSGSWRPKLDILEAPWASFWIEKDRKNVLAEGGYHEFPFMVPRWTKDSQEDWGRGPGMEALPDTKMLNEMSKTDIKAMQKIADPPIIVGDEMRMQPVRLTPGGITYYRGERKPEVWAQPTRVELALEYEEQRRRAISICFFNDLFLMLQEQDKRMTATEVLERAQERLVLLGPTLGRLCVELFDPLLSRSFWILMRGGYLPPVPRELVGRGLEIEYTSKLAMAMKLFEVQAATQGIGYASQLVEVAPEVMDNFDLDATTRGVAERVGTPTVFLRPIDKRDKMRAERAAAQARQQQQLMELEQAKVIPPGKAIEPGSPMAQMQEAAE